MTTSAKRLTEIAKKYMYKVRIVYYGSVFGKVYLVAEKPALKSPYPKLIFCNPIKPKTAEKYYKEIMQP